MAGYKKKIAGITIELDADTSALVKKLDGVSRQIGGIGREFEKVGGNLTRNVTVPIVGAGTVMVSKFAEVDKTMTLANKTMGNTADEADLINQAMKEAAANSTFGMDEAATATLNYARAGLSAKEAALALAPAMNLAAGEGGDLDTVSGNLVGTINGFGDTFDKAEHYTDVFAAACNNSMLEINSLTNSMGVAAPVFKTAGKSVEDAALYLGIMADNNIDAEKAANALKTGIARLAAPTKPAIEAMEKYGMTMDAVWNKDGSMKDLTVIQKNLHEAFADLSEQEQMAAASAIFGKNQMAPWLALINAAPSDVNKLADSIANCDGLTQEMADAMMSGFGGSIEKVKSSLDVLMTSMGELISTYLVPLIEKVQTIIDKFNALDDETKDRIIRIAGIVAAVGPIILIIGKVITAISGIISIVSALSAVLPLLAGPVGIVIAAIAALIAIGVLLYKNWDEIKAKAEIIWNNIKKFIEITIDLIKKAVTGKFDEIKNKITTTFENVKKVVTTIFDAIKNKVSDSVNAMFDKVKDKFNGIKDTIKGVIDFIKSLFSHDLEFPHFKLPHFDIYGGELPWGIGGKGSPPQIDVEWYAKAMNQPYMLDGASIFGAMNGKLLGGGETGSEMIIGTNKLMDMIAKAKGGDTIFNNSFTIDGASGDPEQLAHEISYYMNLEMKRMQFAQGMI